MPCDLVPRSKPGAPTKHQSTMIPASTTSGDVDNVAVFGVQEVPTRTAIARPLAVTGGIVDSLPRT